MGGALAACAERNRDPALMTYEDRRGEALQISRDAERLANMGKTGDAILRYQEAADSQGGDSQ